MRWGGGIRHYWSFSFICILEPIFQVNLVRWFLLIFLPPIIPEDNVWKQVAWAYYMLDVLLVTPPAVSNHWTKHEITGYSWKISTTLPLWSVHSAGRWGCSQQNIGMCSHRIVALQTYTNTTVNGTSGSTLWTKKCGSTFVTITLENLDGF